MIAREPADSPDARLLTGELDDVLQAAYPPESRHGYSVDMLIREGVHFFVARVDGAPAGCAGVEFVPDGGYGELKRMYVRPAWRGARIGLRLLQHIEDHTRSAGYMLLRLETGVDQAAAIRLYEAAGYRRIPPFGPYWDDPVSLCYEKMLS
jgi:putative acetyltransferase